MDREHGGLGSYACDRVRWLELADFLDREGITFRPNVNVPTETFSVDGGRSAVVIPDGEAGGDERVARPVEQTNRQTMVARQRHPLPKIRFSGNILCPFEPEPLEPMPLFTGNLGKRLPLELGDSANTRNKVVSLGIGNTPEKEAVELRTTNGFDEIGVRIYADVFHDGVFYQAEAGSLAALARRSRAWRSSSPAIPSSMVLRSVCSFLES